jgi:hypothetical protein
VARVEVQAEAGPNRLATSRAGGAVFGLGDLFGVQREWLAAHLGREAGDAMRRALDEIRPVLEPLLAEGTVVSREGAALLGWAGAIAVAAGLERQAALPALVARVRALRAWGAVFPADWLAPRVARALGERLAALPEGAAEALTLLDLAEAAGVVLDLGPAQVRAHAWWKGMHQAEPSAALLTLRTRLGLAPPESP